STCGAQAQRRKRRLWSPSCARWGHSRPGRPSVRLAVTTATLCVCVWICRIRQALSQACQSGLTADPMVSVTRTFAYVSNAQDGTIDANVMDANSGALTPIGETDAGKMVMPMAVSPNKKTLYAVIRSQPLRVLSYAIDPATGKLTQKASAPLPDSMPYVSTDRTGRFLFTASYGRRPISF